MKAKKALVKAKKDENYRAFLANTKMPADATPGSGGSSTESRAEAEKKRKAAVHDLREKFATRTTLGKSPGWSGRSGRTPSPKASPIRPRSKKPSPVRAPSANEPVKPATVLRGLKYKGAKVDPDQVFMAAAHSVSKTVNSIIIEDGYKVAGKSPPFGFVGQAPPAKIPDSLPHEKTLADLVLPEMLQTGEWKDMWEKWNGANQVDVNLPPSELMKTIYDGLRAAHSKMDLLKDILNLHSVAHIHVLKAT